jgi:N-acetylated-alpha-linked acidic dipeptidase
MRRFIAALIGASLLLSMPLASHAGVVADEGYMLDSITAAGILNDSTRINQESHYASTPGDLNIAKWMGEQLTASGFHVTQETFNHDVPFSEHLTLTLMTSAKHPIGYTLTEVPIPEDPDGTRRDSGTPFNAWSASGRIANNAVDAGHGLESDYAALKARNIDIRTRIAIVRYGREFRGLLAKRAQEHGARAVIFFSDPADRDGSERGPAYPDGPYRPLGSVQRGSLNENNVSIPTLPVTATTAQAILGDMKDGVTVHAVRLIVEMHNRRNATMWNTVGIIRGTDPTHMVVLGGHRDAWVYGVTDNGSGISSLLEAARGLGYLLKAGWRPRYTIMIVGFDAEEIGELGSKAFVQAHRGELENGCIAYLNLDEVTTGQNFGAAATASIENLIGPLTQKIKDPAQSGGSLFYRWQKQPGGARVEGVGGGSDHEAFLYDIGTPVFMYGFGGIFGVYHSGFDDLRYATTQADPSFTNHQAVARLAALAALRLSSGTVGYSFYPYVGHMRDALNALGHSSDLSPVSAAVNRFALLATRIDQRGGDGNREIAVVHRLNKLFYGRNGYAAVSFPDVSSAIASGNEAAISAAAGRAAHELDDLSAALASATNR